jgi:uncharacterized protein
MRARSRIAGLGDRLLTSDSVTQAMFTSRDSFPVEPSMPTPISAPSLPAPLRRKYVELQRRIDASDSALVAFSGGVDSALVAYLAHRALGERSLAVTADSPAVPRGQLADARRFAAEVGLAHEVIATDELDDADYRRNAANRCFFCKTELYGKMTSLARRRGFAVVWDGTNADDATDYRPGIAAADRQGVSSPLNEAGLQKSEVRQLSRLAGLSTWDKPAAACLSSRVAYGLEVTPEVLARIEAGEEALRELGFRQFRVRHHGLLVRIEIDPPELPRALDPAMAEHFVELFKGLGYQFVSLDLEGYRSGGLNAELRAPRG